MTKLSADTVFYENLRNNTYQKLIRLQLRYYRTVDGAEHPGYVVPLGMMTELIMLLRVPLAPRGVDPDAEPLWLLPESSRKFGDTSRSES